MSVTSPLRCWQIQCDYTNCTKKHTEWCNTCMEALARSERHGWTNTKPDKNYCPKHSQKRKMKP